MQLADILLRRGLLKPHQVEQAQAAGGEADNLLEKAVELGMVDEAEALRADALGATQTTPIGPEPRPCDRFDPNDPD